VLSTLVESTRWLRRAFLLCIFYALIGVDLVAVVHLSSDPYEYLFPKSAWLSMAVSVFFGLFSVWFTFFFCYFHVYLVGFAYTTLEFRERIWTTKTGYSPYDLGFYRNICAVLGEKPLLWLIPILNSPGDGVNWCENEGECKGGYGGQSDDDPLLLNNGGVKNKAASLKTTSKPGNSDGDDSGDAAETGSNRASGTRGQCQSE